MTKLTRSSLLAAGAASVAAAAGASVVAQESNAFRAVPIKDGFTTLSPREALQFLVDGNNAFLAGRDSNPPMGTQRRLELAKRRTVAFAGRFDDVAVVR